MRALVHAALAVAALLGLAGCGAKRIVDKRPLAEVHAILADIDELPPVFGSQEPDLTLEASDPSKVSWILTRDGDEIMRFSALLVPVEQASTAVEFAISGPVEGRFGNVQKRLEEHPALANLYLTAMREQVVSTLEDRPFDITKTYTALSGAVGENMGTISSQMHAAADAASKQDEENIRRAYADEGAGQ